MTIPMQINGKDHRNLSELLGLLAHSNVRVVELMDSCREQRDAGQLIVAEPTIIQAQRLLDDIRKLENVLRLRQFKGTPQPPPGC